MPRYYYNAEGKFRGVYDEGTAPQGLSYSESAPESSKQIFFNGAWRWPLDVKKAERLEEVKAEYFRRLDLGMLYQGKVLQIDTAAQLNITTMGQEARWALATQPNLWPQNFAWRMQDNTFLPLPTPQDMITLGEAAKAEVYRLRQVKWAHDTAILGFNNVEAVIAYDISVNWDQA